VGDGQVTNSVTVTVDPGSVIYAVEPLKVAPRLTVVGYRLVNPGITETTVLPPCV
jgi:hypothetical protein